ncbi:hypothetical protein C5167_049567 [Papaver somniferum]|uniref:Uncharacterized protein n=1 Tax=Papaver somniferum TaxID=3469 RepID=A0A4Y7KQC0_PAPSO|nr:hypothetical protein C5167_049567 [Papaver somniferum]
MPESMFLHVPHQAHSTRRPAFSISLTCDSIQASYKEFGPGSKKMYLNRSVEDGFANPIPRLNKKSYDVRCALSYRWFVEGGFTPLVYGTRAPNNENGVNWIAFQFLELPRLVCNYYHRLGHLTDDCIEIYLLNHRRRHSPPPFQLAPHLRLISPPAPPPSPENNYSEEERFNVDVEDPDPEWNDWSLEVHPSPISSSQEQSALSFSGAEQAYRGYNQDGFNSYMASSSETTNSDDFYGWMRNYQAHTTQERERNMAASTDEEDINMHDSVQQPAEAASQQHQIRQSRINVLTSDIEADFDLVSDDSSSSTNRPTRPSHKRANPEQQAYFQSSGIGTSSASIISRRIIFLSQ